MNVNHYRKCRYYKDFLLETHAEEKIIVITLNRRVVKSFLNFQQHALQLSDYYCENNLSISRVHEATKQKKKKKTVRLAHTFRDVDKFCRFFYALSGRR